MTFLHPNALWLELIAIAIIALYLRKLGRPARAGQRGHVLGPGPRRGVVAAAMAAMAKHRVRARATGHPDAAGRGAGRAERRDAAALWLFFAGAGIRAVRRGMVSLSTPLDELKCTGRLAIRDRAAVVAGGDGRATGGGLLCAAKPGPLPPSAADGVVDRPRAAARRIVFALCGLKVSRETSRQFVVLAVDESRSVTPEVAKIVRPYVDAASGQGRGDRVVYLPFAAKPGTVATELAAPRSDTPPGTDIAAALAAARAAMPAEYVPRIVLFSDGNATAGDALAAAGAAGVPISTVPLPGPEHEVYVAAVTAPAQVRAWEPFEVDVVSQSTHDDSCTVELRCGSKSLGRQQIRIHSGENHVRLPVTAAADGPAMTLTARMSGCQDTIPENNEGGCVVAVGQKPRMLLVESRPEAAARLAAALRREHVEVTVGSPREMPDRAADLDPYDLVVLSNVPAEALPAERMESICRYVDGGGGLIAVGGDQSFTPGGYRGTPLEDILPVRSEARKDKPRPTLAMVLVLDCSGSMEGKSITLAKQASRRAIGMLGPRDQVGILAFEDKNWWVSPLHVCDDKEQVLRRLDTIVAGGETDMYPALDKAYLALRESSADLKHMIVLTDGVSSPGDFYGLVKKIAAAGITVSTVAIGEEADGPLLRDIAEQAKGHFYFCDDVARVPRIFVLETSIAGKMGVTEEPFFPRVVHAVPWLAGLDFPHAPTLLGYVETQPKPAGQLVLAAKNGDPLLVLGHYGRGTSVAFTSDIESRWAAAWLRWAGFDRFWARLAREAMRKLPLARRADDGPRFSRGVPHPADQFGLIEGHRQGERRSIRSASGRIALARRPDRMGDGVHLAFLAGGRGGIVCDRLALEAGELRSEPGPSEPGPCEPGRVSRGR